MYLPTDHKCAIRQDFAASLLLTPLFFSGFLVEFLASNEEEMRGEALYRGGTLSPGRGRQAPCRPLGRGPPPRAPRPPPGTCLRVWKKNYRKVPVAHCLVDRE